MSGFKDPKFPLQQILELACAAQRHNKDYIKTLSPVYADDGDIVTGGKVMYYKYENRILMLVTLGQDKSNWGDIPRPPLLCTNLEDRALATDIQKYYRRLAFTAIEGGNEFLTEINSLLNSDEIALNKLGFIACLPSVYKRDFSRHQIEKRIKTADDGYLGSISSQVEDLDCEVLSSQRSKNYDAWNIDAIIDNKMVSWMSKTDLQLGPAVIVKAKVKDHSKHWKHGKDVTRLNYVKAAQ